MAPRRGNTVSEAGAGPATTTVQVEALAHRAVGLGGELVLDVAQPVVVALKTASHLPR